MSVGLDVNLGAIITGSAVIVGYLAKIASYLRAIRSALGEFPPHRHVNGKILYSTHFKPSEIEQLGTSTGQ